MLVPEDMQRTVNHQPQKLFSSADVLPARILAGDLGADIDIADHRAPPGDAAEPE